MIGMIWERQGTDWGVAVRKNGKNLVNAERRHHLMRRFRETSRAVRESRVAAVRGRDDAVSDGRTKGACRVAKIAATPKKEGSRTWIYLGRHRGRSLSARAKRDTIALTPARPWPGGGLVFGACDGGVADVFGTFGGLPSRPRAWTDRRSPHRVPGLRPTRCPLSAPVGRLGSRWRLMDGAALSVPVPAGLLSSPRPQTHPFGARDEQRKDGTLSQSFEQTMRAGATVA
jgi:hypothetical protein